MTMEILAKARRWCWCYELRWTACLACSLSCLHSLSCCLWLLRAVASIVTGTSAAPPNFQKFQTVPLKAVLKHWINCYAWLDYFPLISVVLGSEVLFSSRKTFCCLSCFQISISNPRTAPCFCFATRCCRDSVPCAISFRLAESAIYPSSSPWLTALAFWWTYGCISFRREKVGAKPSFFLTWDVKTGSRWPVILQNVLKSFSAPPPPTPTLIHLLIDWTPHTGTLDK